jgi:SAM-dependent methyltransferase
VTEKRRQPGARHRSLRNSFFFPFHAVNAGIRRAVVNASAGCSGGTLLDIGCGLRPYEDLFPVDRYFGFDLLDSPRPPGQKLPDVWFDGETIPVRDNSAQHVLCTAVMQYCLDPHSFMRELVRILKPGGNLILVVPQSEALMEAPFDRYRYTLCGVQHLCAAHGLRILRAQAAVGFWQSMAFHLNCMVVRSMLRHGRLPALLICGPLGFMTQSLAAILDKFTAYSEDTNSWVVRAIKTGVTQEVAIPVETEYDLSV